MASRSRHHSRAVALVLTFGLIGFAPVPAAAAVTPGCGDTITQNVTLTADILNCFPSASGAALVIGADNIVLDGNGFTIDGQSAYSGVLVDGHKNVTIKNLFVTEFGQGVVVRNSKRVRILSSDVDATTAAIARIEDSGHVTLRGNELGWSGGGGVWIVRSSHTSLIDNKLSGADFGFAFQDTTKNLVRGNEVSGSYFDGFLLIATTKSTFRSNTATLHWSDGFKVDAASTGNRFIGNETAQNALGFEDASEGRGTSGTANRYDGNVCPDGSSPAGLCSVPTP
jgi:parallel beta-helix repeat protein